MIQEEHLHHPPPPHHHHQPQQQSNLLSVNYSYSNRNKSRSSSSSETSAPIDEDEHMMDCDEHPPNLHHQEQNLFSSSHFHPSTSSPSRFYYNTSPLTAQHLPIPTTTSSYVP